MGWLVAGCIAGVVAMFIGSFYCYDCGYEGIGTLVTGIGVALLVGCLIGIRSAHEAETAATETVEAGRPERSADPATVEIVEGPATVIVVVEMEARE